MPTITLPTNFTASTTAQTGSLFSDFSAPIYFVLAIVGLAVIFAIIISSIHGRQ